MTLIVNHPRKHQRQSQRTAFSRIQHPIINLINIGVASMAGF